MDTNFRLSLESTGPRNDCHVFRVAFEASDDRYLLNYPEVAGLQFTSLKDRQMYQLTTRFLASSPPDEFVLNPQDRIAFDLRVYIDLACTNERQWTVDPVPGEYDVVYCYSIDPKRRRYDYLNRGSRFADITKPWTGSIVSNTVRFRLDEPLAAT